jgi:hypothetical protein
VPASARTRGAAKHSRWKTDIGNCGESDMRRGLAEQARGDQVPRKSVAQRRRCRRHGQKLAMCCRGSDPVSVWLKKRWPLDWRWMPCDAELLGLLSRAKEARAGAVEVGSRVFNALAESDC